MRTILCAQVLILALVLAAGAAPQATIMVRPESEVSAANCMLADIAAVQCGAEELAQKLANVSICPSPLPGKTRKLTREQIVVALRRAGISDGTADLLCPAEVAVKRSLTMVTGQALFEATREFALTGRSWPGTVAVEPTRLPADQAVPSGKLELRVKAGSREARKGRNSLPVEIVVDDQIYRTVHVPLLVKVSAPVLVSAQAIPRGTAISPANVALQERDITNLPDDVLLEEPSGDWSASVPIPEGAVIRRHWVDEPPAVRSGDAVLVVVEAGAVRVTDKGTAVQDGRPGQRIKVRFTGDVREIRGPVAEPGVVKICIPDRRNER